MKLWRALRSTAVHLVAPLVLIASTSGCLGDADTADTAGAAGGPDEEVGAAAQEVEPATWPKFDEVWRKGTHNSYFTGRWVNNMEVGASGSAQRLTDQLFHEHVRSIEIDISPDHDKPGSFNVRHSYNNTDSAALTEIVSAVGGVAFFDPLVLFFGNLTLRSNLKAVSQANSQCSHLTDCLGLLKRLDYLLPDHEAMVVHLELKETNLLNFGARVFIPTHTMADLDSALWEALGPRLYTPRELLLSRPGCANEAGQPVKTLRDCVKDAGWPDINELRGRTIVTIHGNWGENYWDWLDYASSDMMSRAAFPMRGIFHHDAQASEDGAVVAKLSACPEVEPWAELNSGSMGANLGRPYIADVGCTPEYIAKITLARNSSVFWDVADPNYTGVPDPSQPGNTLPDHPGMQQFFEQHGVARADSGQITGRPGVASARLEAGYQILPDDQPWGIPGDADTEHAIPLPSNPAHAVFQQVSGGAPPSETYTEPGHRLYLHLSGSGEALADGVKLLPYSGGSSVDVWETHPSTTRPPVSSDQAAGQEQLANGEAPIVAANPATMGSGCLVAGAEDYGSVVNLCREMTDDPGNLDDEARPWVTVYTHHRGQEPEKLRFKLEHKVLYPLFGDMLRLSVLRSPGAGGGVSAVVRVESASTIGANGDPIYEALVPDIAFDEDLPRQGVWGTGDVLFVGTKHNDADVHAADLQTAVPDRLIELSADAYGTRRWEDNRSLRYGGTLRKYVGVHRSVGTRAGEVRHLYTTNVHEARAAGVTLEAEDYFFLDSDHSHGGTAMLNLARIGHKVRLTTAPDCLLGADLARYYCAEKLGYISTSPTPSTVPLFELYAPGNGSWFETGDYFYTTSEAEANAALALGYTNKTIVGYVWLAGTLTETGPIPPACFSAWPPAYCLATVLDSPIGMTYGGKSIGPYGVSWYKAQVPPGGVAEAYLNIGNGNDIDLALVPDPAGYPVSNSTGYSNVELVRANLAPGSWYYLRVMSYAPTTTPYSVSLSEPSDTYYEVAEIQNGAYGYSNLYHGGRFMIDSPGEVDYYRVSVGKGVYRIKIDFTHAAGDVDMVLLDGAGTPIAWSTGVGNSEQVIVPSPYWVYYVKVYGYNGAVNSYSMTVTPY